MQLLEKTRSKVIADSKHAANYAPSNQQFGRNRFERRRISSISKNTSAYNRIDFNTFFKKDILTFKIEVRGETNNYLVTIKLLHILQELQRILKDQNKEVENKDILIALQTVLENKDIYFHCTCPDWKYRMQFHAINKGIAADLTNPGPGKGIANPYDDKGDGCKHVMLVLSNVEWKRLIANVINNYINLIKERQERLYQTLIFPAVYGKRYSDEIQQQLFNPDTGNRIRNYLPTGKQTVNLANKQATERTKFKTGNVQGVRFAKETEPIKPIEEINLSLDDINHSTAELKDDNINEVPNDK